MQSAAALRDRALRLRKLATCLRRQALTARQIAGWLNCRSPVTAYAWIDALRTLGKVRGFRVVEVVGERDYDGMDRGYGTIPKRYRVVSTKAKGAT